MSTYTIDGRPEAVVYNPDPIDVIVTGYPTDHADLIGATNSPTFESEYCHFVDCDEVVFYPKSQMEAAVDLIVRRGEFTSHSDDCLLVCCRSHRGRINNSPSIVGPDIYAACNAIRAASK